MGKFWIKKVRTSHVVLRLKEFFEKVDPLFDHVVDDGLSELRVENVIDLVEESLEVAANIVVHVS